MDGEISFAKISLPRFFGGYCGRRPQNGELFRCTRAGLSHTMPENASVRAGTPYAPKTALVN